MIEAVVFGQLARSDLAIAMVGFVLELATEPLGVLAISLTVGTVIARRLP